MQLSLDDHSLRTRRSLHVITRDGNQPATLQAATGSPWLAFARDKVHLADAGLFRAADAGGEGREEKLLPFAFGVEARDGVVIACE